MTGFAPNSKISDEKLATTYRVDSTPTLFVNGVRGVGLGSLSDMRIAIRAAMAAQKKGESGH